MSNSNVDVNYLESENDLEIIEILSRKPSELPDAPDKPLSPVLCRSRVSRRHLFSQRAKHKKTRVNLSERFRSDTREDITELKVKEFDDNSLTVSQTDSLIERLEILEEIERNRRNLQKLVTSNKPHKRDDFYFKKPILTPGKHKKVKTNSQSPVVSKTRAEDIYVGDKIYFKNLPDCKINFTQSSGFQTATGKGINVAEDDIKTHSLLFNDILNSSETPDVTRPNKYSFLCKTENVGVERINKVFVNRIEQEFSLTQEIGVSGISDTQMLGVVNNILDKNETIGGTDSDLSGFPGFTRIEIVESMEHLHELHMACENIDDLEGRHSNKRKLVDELSSLKKRQKRGYDSNEADGEISNIASECRLISSPRNKIGKLNEILINNKFNMSNNKDSSIKPRLDIQCFEKNNQNNVSENKTKRPLHSAGFSRASGKSINLSEESVLKAKQVFEAIENSSSERIARMKLLGEHLKCSESEQLSITSPHKSDVVRENSKPKFVRSLLSGFQTLSEKPINSVERSFSVSENLKVAECGPENGTNSVSIPRQCQKRKFNKVDDLRLDHAVKKNAIQSLFRDSGVVRDFSKTFMQRAEASCSDAENEAPERITSRNKLKLLDDAEAEISVSIQRSQQQYTVSENSHRKLEGNRAVQGFATASGAAIKFTEKSMQTAKGLFSDIENEQPSGNITKATTRNKLLLLDEALTGAEIGKDCVSNQRSIQQYTLGENSPTKLERNRTVQGFSNTSGATINLTEKSMQTAKGLFSDIENEQLSGNITKATSRNKLMLLDGALTGAEIGKNGVSNQRSVQQHTLGENSHTKLERNRRVLGFSKASGASIKLTEKSMHTAKVLFSDIENEPPSESVTRITSRNKLKLLDDAIKEAEKKMGLAETDTPRIMSSGLKRKPTCLLPNVNKLVGGPCHSTPIKSNQNQPLVKSSKKNLGISSYQVLPLSESKLHRAKLLFGEDCPEASPIKPSHTSTPLRPLGSSFSGIVEATTVFVDSSNENIVLGPNSSFVIASPTKGKALERAKEFGQECVRLQERFKVISERQKAQESVNLDKSEIDKKSRIGVLYNKKFNSERRSIFTLSNGNYTDANDLFCVTPRNAEHFHFKESSSIVSTEDGATVIPNLKDLIGLSEIEFGFNSMPGVDPRLLPKGWLRNHFRWIVWKLASYERIYPDNLKGSLSVENVIQQLKYRYDREIDKAQRPALRRILEKDDAPQKRMVLCVSDIITYEQELELTDGWYPVRTVVDELLYKQVKCGRIRVGTKLVIAGAELLNCDGCHPLEVTDLTCLKINYNSTRRAIWHAKLGYQPHSEPFPIRISTVHPLGGAIGALRICIVRIYPVKYWERMGTNTVWRNEKAEERRAQDWENEQSKRREKIEEGIRKEFSKSFECAHQVSILKTVTGELSSISSPKMLFELVKNSNDPDTILEKLTASQRSALMEYRNSQHLINQQQINARIKENVDKFKLVKRDVSAVLRLLVADASEDSGRLHNFFIWQPNESHRHMLKEMASMTVYNVLGRKNGDLNSSSKTVFKPSSDNFVINECYKRQVIHIESLPESNFTSFFKDFDTVGIVVETTVESKKQEVWLTGLSGRLLMVEVTDGPSNCLLLDKLRRGSATTVCNLLYCGFKDDVVYAMASHCTVFSSYSQHKHLQQGLETLKTKLPKDLKLLLDDCDNRIILYRLNPSTSAKFNSFARLDDSDEDTLVQSRLTSTDVALSLIDIDKFI